MTALLLCVLVGVAPARDAKAIQEKLVAFGWRLQGRVLGCLIREGMTVEQVDQILGSPNLNLCAGTTGGLWGFRQYGKLGVTVSFSESSGPERKYRVNLVDFEP